MPDDLSVAMERLRTSTQRLNSVSDVAAQVIRDAEAFLEECRVGVECSVLVKSEDETGEEKYFTTTHLAYRRYGGKYRIVVHITPFDATSPEDESIRPWSESNRDEKIDSLGLLPELLVKLANQVEERASKAEEAVAGIGALLQLPKKKGGA